MKQNAFVRKQSLRLRQRGSVMFAVMILCLALLVVSTAFFSAISYNRRINQHEQIRIESREGAEAAVSFATAEINRRAVGLSAFEPDAVTDYTINTSELASIAGAGVKSDVVASSVEVKVGSFTQNKTTQTLLTTDPAYSGDDSKGLTVGTRHGLVYAKATAKDPVTGYYGTSYVAGVVQLRERNWFNYGFFYNMDMEVFPGPRMDVRGAMHTNGDMYLGKDGTGDGLYIYKSITSAGHIYRGIKYCIKDYNLNKSVTGFENKVNWNVSNGEGSGHVYVTKDGSDADMPSRSDLASLEMLSNNDCLWTGTNPDTSAVKTHWINEERTTWKSFVQDSSLNIDKFTPPGMPLYVAEDYETTSTTELRNHGYAMIEPQLPATDDTRYYGKKASDMENMKFSGLAGLTIVVDDNDRDVTAAVPGAQSTLNASVNGYAIPWKLVWYKGSTNASSPITKENLPARGADGKPVPYVLDPFDKNDEVDAAEATALGQPAVVVTMQRNLKALLRDCIVVVPYRDALATATTFGTGNTVNGANPNTLTTFPSNASYCGFTSNTAPTATNAYASRTRYNQRAGSWPKLNDGVTAYAAGGTSAAFYNVINVRARDAYRLINGTTLPNDRYPASSSDCAGAPSNATDRFSGIYSRRQGYAGNTGVGVSSAAYNNTTTSSTNYNSGLKGAFHVVYIDLQKLDWIINHQELWLHPTTGAVTFDPTVNFNNIIYVDLPSAPKTASRHGAATGVANTEPDKICPALAPTATTPGYALMLYKGARLPRLRTYDAINRTPGLTIATNGPLYIKGNYNADGERNTGSSLLPDSDASTAATSNAALWYDETHMDAEIPALVAADAVILVSENFRTQYSAADKYDAHSLYTAATAAAAAPVRPVTRRYNGYGRYAGVGDATAVDGPNADNSLTDFMEVSTAIITGLSPTIPDRAPNNAGKNTQSGAINNLPRFEEDWGSKTLRYRGAMAALYDCEVMTSRFIQGSHGYWFDPPNRDWGYHQYLAAGRNPPGTPVVRTARLISLYDIDKATYEASGAPPQPTN